MITHCNADIRYLLSLGMTAEEIGNRMSLPEDAVLALLNPADDED